MTVRRVSSSDAGAIAALVIESAMTVARDFSEDGWELFLSVNTAGAIGDRCNDERYQMLCFEQEQKLLGMISLYEKEKIDQLFVLPGFAQQGIARQLWKQARLICESAGGPASYWVRSSTSAEPVYQKFGFVASGERQSRNGISFQLMTLGDF